MDSNTVDACCGGSSSSNSTSSGDCCNGGMGSISGGGCGSATMTTKTSHETTTTSDINNDVTNKNVTKITHIRPILTPYELEVALGMSEWQEVYPMEYYSHDGGPWSNGNIIHRPTR